MVNYTVFLFKKTKQKVLLKEESKHWQLLHIIWQTQSSASKILKFKSRRNYEAQEDCGLLPTLQYLRKKFVLSAILSVAQ